MNIPGAKLVGAVLLAALVLAGCGKDKAKEYFDAEEAKEKAQKEETSPAKQPELDLESLIGAEKKKDDGIPPPVFVDVREATTKFDDGTPKVVCSVKYFSDGSTIRHGKYVEWYPNGKKFKEGQYEDGKKVGQWTVYFDDGKKAKSGTYKNDACDGVWTYWSPDGNKQREESYRQGVRHGAWIRWHPNGQKASECTYTDGKRDGKETRWDKDGNELR